MIPSKRVDSLSEFVTQVTVDSRAWEPAFPWFRGEPGNTSTPLTPRVFRRPKDKPDHHFDENNLLQTFRRRAHLLGLPVIPPREATDQWLFLARHVGLPTRLLDWTEGALLALYFALCDSDGDVGPLVWMLNPHELNKKTAPDALPNVFPITWHEPEGVLNPAYRNIAAAWQLARGAVDLPVAIEPTTVHPRMNAQHSYFTVHGSKTQPLSELVAGECLRRYEIALAREQAFRELRLLGVARSTILPDADSLSEELSEFLVVRDCDAAGEQDP